MRLEDKIKATAKNAEGRLQAATGDVTGDERLKAEGEAKQVQSHLGTLKDKVQQAAASVGDAIDDLAGKGSSSFKGSLILQAPFQQFTG